ncbi:MAG: YggT family protein [Candidatus Nanopelagicaceae bacterium]|nr:YggT family protein [Candidatus Nanopelagicaceae bacterium]
MINLTSWIVLALNLFLLSLFLRLILDYVRMFKPGWRPRGIILPLAEIIYMITDKPLSFVRRFVPPLRMGPVALDLSFIVLFFGTQILIAIIA